MSLATAPTPTADSRLDALIAEESGPSSPASRAAASSSRERASLAGGATSNWQIAEPQAVWISHGARLEDLRRRRQRVRPTSTAATASRWPATPTRRSSRRSSDRVARGTHFAQPTEDAIVVADNLAERFGLPLWRFGNSGTEATMDAVHLMRAATGRDRIIKVEGCYHGHHDSVQVSVLPEPDDDIGPADGPAACPATPASRARSRT